MIVLDASVLIAHLDASDAHHERAGALLLDVADESLGASLLSLAEVLVGPARAGQLDRATAVLHQLEVTARPSAPTRSDCRSPTAASTPLRVTKRGVLVWATRR